MLRKISVEEREQIWLRRAEGQSITQISQALGRAHTSVIWALAVHGGIVPRKPTRSDRQLTLCEREQISRGLSVGCSYARIARELNRSTSTVSREVARNGGRKRYRAVGAEDRACQQARRPKACVLALNAPLRWAVCRKLEADWSPQQISGWLAKEYAHDKSMRVSHETIYRSLFLQARGVLKKELIAHLRRARSRRHSKAPSAGQRRRSSIVDAVCISERPAEAADRAVPGHWEGDLVCGSTDSWIATLVERHSRYVMLVKVPSKQTHLVVNALSRHMRKLPEQLRRSLTWDRGAELAAHKTFSMATDMPVYFCDPYSPWQRGSNENTNGLLRQYFPKGSDLSVFSQAQLNAIARKLNERPRKTLGFSTPAEKLTQALH
jgi:IS30 family transposase